MFLFRRWNGVSAPPSSEDAKSPSKRAGIHPSWSMALKHPPLSTSPPKSFVHQRDSQRKKAQIPSFLTYLDHQLSRADGGVLRPSSSPGGSVTSLTQHPCSLGQTSLPRVLKRTTSPSTPNPFVSQSLLSTRFAPSSEALLQDHINNTQLYTCAVDDNLIKHQSSRLHTQAHHPTEDHIPLLTPSSCESTKHPDFAYLLPYHSHQEEASLALLEPLKAEEGSNPPSDHLVTCTSSGDSKDLLDLRLWALPLQSHHQEYSLSANDSGGALISGDDFDVRLDRMSIQRDFVSSVSSPRSSERLLYDNPADALRQITGRRLASSGAFSRESASTISRGSEPISPTGRLKYSRSNPFQFANDLDPTLPRYAPTSIYANEQSLDYAAEGSWNDTMDSIYDKYDEEGSSSPTNTRSAGSGDDSNEIDTGALNIKLEHINRVSVLSSPMYMTANSNAANLVPAEPHAIPQSLQESEVLPQPPTTPRLEREDSTIFETPSPPPALTQAAQAAGHIGHALSTIFEASSPPGTTSTVGLAVIPTRMETPTPTERPDFGLLPGPAPTNFAANPSNDLTRCYQSALHEEPYVARSTDASTNELTSIQTPSTGILFPKGSSHFQKKLDHEDLIETPTTDQSCNVHGLTSEKLDLVESNNPYRKGPSTNIPNASIPKQWNGGSMSRKRPSPIKDNSSVHQSSDSSSESWEDITVEPSIKSTVQPPEKPVRYDYAPKSHFFEAEGSDEYLPTPAGSVYEFTPSPAPRLSQELEQLAASMGMCKELESSRIPSPTTTAYRPPQSPPATPSSRITSQHQRILDVIGSETMLKAEVLEDGPQRTSYDSFTTIELEEMANPSGVIGKKNRLSKMMDPIWRIGSGAQRTQEVVEAKKAELEKKKKLPRSVVLHGSDSRRLVKVPTVLTNQVTDDHPYTQHRGPSASRSNLPQAPYRIQSDSRSITPELDFFGASPAPYSPLPEPCQDRKSSGKLVGHNAQKMSYLSVASVTNSNLQRSSDFTRYSAILDGRYPSPKVRRSYMENKGNIPPRLPQPAYIPSRVISPGKMDPEDIEMQIRKPLKAIKPCATKERGASSYHSATLSEHDRNMLEKSEHWHEFRETNPNKLYYPVGDRIYHSSNDGSRDRLVATRRPAPEVPPGDGSHEQKKGEQFVWFALGFLSIVPFFIPLFIVGVFNETFFRMTNNRWAAPNQRHIYVAIRILWAWGVVMLTAIIATIIGLSRAASFH